MKLAGLASRKQTAKPKTRIAPPPEPEEPETPEGEEEVDLEKMDRAELKSLIKKHDLDITVYKSMSDDDIREAIAAAVDAEPEDPEPEPEPEPEDPEPEPEDPEPEPEPEDPEPEPEDPEDAEPASGKGGKPSGVAAWMKTGKEMEEEAKAAEKRAASSSSRMFFVPAGETRTVRFRDDTPICGLYVYSAHDGRRWIKVTQPPDPSDDLFAKAGRRPQFVLVYEVFDRAGYTSKDGKKVVDVPRLWMVPDKLHKQFQNIAAKHGGLTKLDIEIHREGVKQPSYALTVDRTAKPPHSKVLASERLAKLAATIFAPPTAAEQRRFLRITEEQDSD